MGRFQYKFDIVIFCYFLMECYLTFLPPLKPAIPQIYEIKRNFLMFALTVFLNYFCFRFNNNSFLTISISAGAE
jgi:hypothetical protein